MMRQLWQQQYTLILASLCVTSSVINLPVGRLVLAGLINLLIVNDDYSVCS